MSKGAERIYSFFSLPISIDKVFLFARGAIVCALKPLCQLLSMCQIVPLYKRPWAHFNVEKKTQVQVLTDGKKIKVLIKAKAWSLICMIWGPSS